MERQERERRSGVVGHIHLYPRDRRRESYEEDDHSEIGSNDPPEALLYPSSTHRSDRRPALIGFAQRIASRRQPKGGHPMEELLKNAPALLTVFGVKIATALVIFIVGRWIARFLGNITRKVMAKRDVDETLVKFVGSLVYIALLTFVILAALAQLGIQTTSFIAVIGAAGLAVGLALQGSLATFAAGVLMILFRPIRVGDEQ